MTITSFPTALAENRPASLLNVVAEALGVATVAFVEEAMVDMVLLVPTSVLNGALVTTGATFVDPVAMELPVDSGNVVVFCEPDPVLPCPLTVAATVVSASP